MLRRRRQPSPEPVEIDTSVAHTSRIYDYLLGGTDNFAVDRKAAEHAFSAYPGGLDGARADARANRAFLGRVVRYLAVEAGIRQFLDVGTGIPNEGNVHTVLRAVAPGARVVYVDNDPIVLAHAHALLRGAPSGSADYIDGDLRQPDHIVERAADTLDFGQPVALLLVGILHVVPDDGDPCDHVATLMGAVPAGSHLALSHMARDIRPDEMAEVVVRLDRTTRESNPPALRDRAEVSRFLDGFELIDPGLVQVDRWRPDGTEPHGERTTPIYAGVGRKPGPP